MKCNVHSTNHWMSQFQKPLRSFGVCNHNESRKSRLQQLPPSVLVMLAAWVSSFPAGERKPRWTKANSRFMNCNSGPFAASAFKCGLFALWLWTARNCFVINSHKTFYQWCLYCYRGWHRSDSMSLPWRCPGFSKGTDRLETEHPTLICRLCLVN